MAINTRCKNCKADLKLTTKKCTCGALVNRKNRSYRVIVRMNGRRITKTVGNYELAKEIESKLKVDIARKDYKLERKQAAPTLNKIWEKYLPWAKEHKKSWRTDDYYYRKHLQPVFGNKQLDQITPFDIEKLIYTLKKGKNARGKSYAPATIKHQIVLLSRLFSLAINWEIYAGENPCNKVKKPALNNQITEFLSDHDLDNLLNTLETWPNKMTAGFVKFALFTGLRRGELFKLKWSDIDLNRKTLTLVDPKGKKDQTIPISDNAIRVLQEIPKEFDSPFVFYGKNGQQRTDFKGSWNRIKKAAKLPQEFRLHGLRHHFASSLVSAGVDLYIVQKLLTHKDASTTQRYAHLADKALRDAVELSTDLFKTNNIAPINRLEKCNNG